MKRDPLDISIVVISVAAAIVVVLYGVIALVSVIQH